MSAHAATHAATGAAPVSAPLPSGNATRGSKLDHRSLLPDGRLKILEAACLPVHGPHLACDACVTACPVDALTQMDQSTLEADESCLGCGRCAAACPTGALSAPGLSFKATPGRPVVLDCRRAPSSDAQAVACLGGLTVEVLLELAAAEVPVTLRDHGWCAECPAGANDPAPWSSVLDEACGLLVEAEMAEDALPQVETAPLPLRRAEPLVAPERRALLRAPITVDAPATPTGRRRAPLEPRARRRRLDALRRVTERTGAPLPAAVRVGLSLAEGCDGQFSCAAFCPTGALTRADVNETTAALTFDAAACIACGQCAQGCPGRALRLTTAPDMPDEPEVLRSFAMTRCRGCGAEFPAQAEEERCPSCRPVAGLFHSLGLFGRG